MKPRWAIRRSSSNTPITACNWPRFRTEPSRVTEAAALRHAVSMTTSLLSTYLRLKPDSSIEELPADGFWQRLMAGQLGNFHHEYLVTTSPYSASWQSWEKHPMG